MKRLLLVAVALLCAVLQPYAFAQTGYTTVTASSLKMSGSLISVGNVTFAPVDRTGIAIPFADASGSLNGPTAYQCAIVAGAITGMVQADRTVSGTCKVPDATLTTPANILYKIQISNTSTGLTTSGMVFTLQQVVGLSGPTWALDGYGPPANTTNVQAIQASHGTTPPSSCIAPFFYTNDTTHVVSTCIGGTLVPIGSATVVYGTTALTAAQGNDSRIVGAVQRTGDTMSGPLILAADPTVALGTATKQYVDNHSSSATLPSGTGLVKSTGGTGSIAVAGTDYAAPASVTAAQAAAAAESVSLTGDTMTGPLVLAADPTANLGASTKQYVDAAKAAAIAASDSAGAATTAAGTKVSKAGDTMTGPLILSADPIVALGSATKQYVDNHSSSATLPSGTGLVKSTSGIGSIAVPGTDYATPASVTAAQAAAAAESVSLSGDTMTGLLTLSGPPTANLHAATKAYVDSAVATGVTTAETAAAAESVSKTGDTMTGPLVLAADPSASLGAATKQYVDNHTAALPGGTGIVKTTSGVGSLAAYGDVESVLAADPRPFAQGGGDGDGSGTPTPGVNQALLVFPAGVASIKVHDNSVSPLLTKAVVPKLANCLASDVNGTPIVGTNCGTVTGPSALPPVVVATPNVNLLRNTDQMANYWNGQDLVSQTNVSQVCGLAGETSNTRGVLMIPNTSNYRHELTYSPVYEPSLTATQPVTLTACVMPSGSTLPYFEFGFYQDAANTTKLANYVNSSTCTVSTSATGVTVTAVTQTSGMCLITATYTVPAATYIATVFFACTPNTTNESFAANGTDGCIVSTPQLSATSAAVQYQGVTDAHWYGSVAYDSGGNTAGVSQLINAASFPSYSEINTVTVPCLTSGGPYTYKIYRGGGPTQGFLQLSGSSTAATCGTTYTDNYLVADGSAAPTAQVVSTPTSPLTDTRHQYVQSTMLNLWGPTGKGGSVNLLTVPPGVAGTVTLMHITEAPVYAGTPTGFQDTQFLHIRTNQAAWGSSGDIVESIGGHFNVEDQPTLFSGNVFAVTNDTGAFFSANAKEEIPFTNGISIDLATAYNAISAPVFAEVSYRVGKYYTSPYRKSYYAYETPLTSYAAWATVPALPLLTSVGGGEMKSIMVFYNNNSNPGYLEGNPFLNCDLIVCQTANGNEDFFGFSFYANNLADCSQTDHWGCWGGAGLTAKPTTGTFDSLWYRNFGIAGGGDNVFFSNSLSFSIGNGQQGRGSNPGASTIKTHVALWLGHE